MIAAGRRAKIAVREIRQRERPHSRPKTRNSADGRKVLSWSIAASWCSPKVRAPTRGNASAPTPLRLRLKRSARRLFRSVKAIREAKNIASVTHFCDSGDLSANSLRGLCNPSQARPCGRAMAICPGLRPKGAMPLLARVTNVRLPARFGATAVNNCGDVWPCCLPLERSQTKRRGRRS